MDIAQLGYEVDSSGLVEATRQLDRNAEAAERTSGSAQILEREYRSLSRAASETGSAVADNDARFKAIAKSGAEWADAMRTANVSERALAEAAREAAAGIDVKAQVMARAGTEQERMAARALALQQAEERASAKTLAAARAAQAQELNLKKLLGQIDPTVAALDRLADQEARLEQARDLGLLKPEVFEQYQQKLDTTRAATLNAGKASDIMTKSLGSLNLQSVETQQSIAALGRALVTGQWGQAQASITSLTARTGIMSKAFSGTGLAVGGLAAGLFGLGAAAHAAERDVSDITNALLVTGNYADVTIGQIDGLVDSLASLEAVTHGGARAALLAVAQTGRFTGEQFEMVAAIAARMEASVGQSLDTTIQKFREIERDPVDALLKLNETEHFLTQAHLDRIDALIAEGDEQAAAAEAARIYADRLDAVATSAENARPHLAQMTSEIKELASAAWEGTKNFTDFLIATSKVTNERPVWQRIGFGGVMNYIRDMYSAEAVSPAGIEAVSGVVDSRKEGERRSAAEAAERDIQRQIESMHGLDTAVNRLEKSFLSLSESRQKALVDSGDYGRLLARAMEEDARKEGSGRRTRRGRSEQDFTEKARKELEKMVEAEARARASFDAMAATLAGPVAEANYRYAVDLQKLRDLAREGAISSDALAEAEANLAAKFEETKEAIDRRMNPVKQMLEDLDFEYRLIGLSNTEREIEIALRYANVSAISEEGKALSEKIRRNIEAAESEQRLIEGMDAVRASGRSFLSDLAQGENPLSAVESALDRLHKKFTDMIAEQLMDQLLGRQGDVGGGKFGGALQGILGSLFGVDTGQGDEAAALSASAGELTASGATLLSAATALSASATALAAAGAAAGGVNAAGASGGGGGGWGNWLSLAMGVISGGGRAYGGDVRDDRFYRIGEQDRPEILNMGRGRQYLIPGDHGRVEPIPAPTSAPRGNTYINVSVEGQVNTQSRYQIAGDLRRDIALEGRNR